MNNTLYTNKLVIKIENLFYYTHKSSTLNISYFKCFNTNRYEKMFGGMYLGEIARRVIIKLSEEKVLFQQMKSNSVLHQAGLSTAFVSQLCRFEIFVLLYKIIIFCFVSCQLLYVILKSLLRKVKI